jgi:hypothetical protein
MNADTANQETDKFRAAIAAMDAYNADDPTTETVDGEEIAAAFLYGRRMTGWLLRLAPDASEALRLAARAQHIGRWKIPRADYAQGRSGYLQWRRDLGKFHAEVAAQILADLGYDDDVIARVGDLVQKKALKRDGEAQIVEDAACLVFLEHQFSDFSAKHEDEKIIDIVEKTLAKMSDHGRAEAGKLVALLPPDRQSLINTAMANGK